MKKTICILNINGVVNLKFDRRYFSLLKIFRIVNLIKKKIIRIIKNFAVNYRSIFLYLL